MLRAYVKIFGICLFEFLSYFIDLTKAPFLCREEGKKRNPSLLVLVSHSD